MATCDLRHVIPLAKAFPATCCLLLSYYSPEDDQHVGLGLLEFCVLPLAEGHLDALLHELRVARLGWRLGLRARMADGGWAEGRARLARV